MSVPLRQAIAVSVYILHQRLRRRKRYPLVLMLEPLYRCNLACAGCGKIQHPEEILRSSLSPEECWAAAEECGAPVVSIAGGEPLVHPQIDRIVEGLVERKRFVYLCTNAILLDRWLPKLMPSPYLTISVHMDGMRELHDAMVDREGVFEKAVAGIREAKRRGFRVSTNTTVYADSAPEQMRELFDFLTDELRVDGMMVSPGYDYPKAPNQRVFLKRPQMIETFRRILSFPQRKRWRF
ncbi:MAG: adenosyl-hopene transferase HpnH, partial [Chloroflexi bacterium]|nr:adenosyl-hopene transferase HpnH [Chloroflexota bacterium]